MTPETLSAERAAFRNAMARLGAAVNIVTTDGAAGRAGLTASAVCSVTDNPPTLLVCVNRASAMNAALKANRVLCVNVLGGAQRALSDVFAGRPRLPAEARFAQAEWEAGETGAPVLRGAVAALECRVAEVLEKGTHSVFFAEVARAWVGPAVPALLWWGRDYHELGAK
jgi:flavin reductase